MGYIKKYKPILTEEEKKYIRAEQNKKYYYLTHKPVKPTTSEKHEVKLNKILEVRNKRKIDLKIIPDPEPEPVVIEPIIEVIETRKVGRPRKNTLFIGDLIPKNVKIGRPRKNPVPDDNGCCPADNVCCPDITSDKAKIVPPATELIDLLKMIKTKDDLDIIKTVFMNHKKN